MTSLTVNVAAIEQVTPLVKHFTLVRPDGEALPAFSGGSHIVVHMQALGRSYRNAYSLMGNPQDTQTYHIAVRLQEASRGGSKFMHEQIAVGSTLQISYPSNMFALQKLARKHLLIAGGIGITPFMSQIADLQRIGAVYELHYAFRSPQHGAFSSELKAQCGSKAHFYIASENNMLNLPQLLGTQALGTHVYVCGPSTLVAAVKETAQALGWPEHHIHSEQFTAPATGEPFKLKLTKSQLEIEVPANMSMLEAIEAAGVDAPYLCRGGACGRCELEVVDSDGSLIHLDHYLSEAEKASGKKIMPCVSRALCQSLELNL
jgi:dimethylamine monooxygenase subunit B